MEEAIELTDVPVDLRLPKAPKRVYTAPEQTDLPFNHAEGRTSVVVPVVAGHQMVVFE